jgi:peptidoglycan/xylan/chitin deacetylase (PgdA/CDA1 family)
VLFTFDDGYSDIAEYALPVLKRYDFGAVVYVVTDRIGARDDWQGEEGERNLLTLMNREQIQHWAARGIEFGGHTRTHCDLTSMSGPELMREVDGCAEDLQQLLGHRPISFAYPYGMYDAQARAFVRKHFELAFTCDEGMVGGTDDPHLLRRMTINPGDTLVEFACKVLYGRNPLGAVRSRLRLRSRFRQWGFLPSH